MSHIPVMLNEVIFYLQPKASGVYVDCTFGAGGYTKGILESSSDCRVIAIDQDPSTLAIAAEFSQQYGSRFTFINDNFANLADLLQDNSPVDGIVLDLGVSSMQLDNAERGFSFAKDAALDMRMSSSGLSAADFLNTADYQTLADVIFFNGDEPQARKIARKIIEARELKPIATTSELANLVRSVVKRTNYSIDAATKTFQAIRIFINDELGALRKNLSCASGVLKLGGKIVCVCFHSLEDRIVKEYFKNNANQRVAQSKYHPNNQHAESSKAYKILTPKPIAPSASEIKQNIRARSAKLRAAEKISHHNAVLTLGCLDDVSTVNNNLSSDYRW